MKALDKAIEKAGLSKGSPVLAVFEKHKGKSKGEAEAHVNAHVQYLFPIVLRSVRNEALRARLRDLTQLQRYLAEEEDDE